MKITIFYDESLDDLRTRTENACQVITREILRHEQQAFSPGSKK